MTSHAEAGSAYDNPGDDDESQGSNNADQPSDVRRGRKEVSYVCESACELAMIVANLFRRAQEAREIGNLQSRSDPIFLEAVQSQVATRQPGINLGGGQLDHCLGEKEVV
jgi:hypothetical protein